MDTIRDRKNIEAIEVSWKVGKAVKHELAETVAKRWPHSCKLKP